MRCPACQADIPSGLRPVSRCPACGQNLSGTNAPLEPELLPPGFGRPNPSPMQHSFTRIFYTTIPAGGTPSGCLPSLITLALTLTAAFKYGLLAAIGFVVFASVGRALLFFLTLKYFLEGRLVNPWFFHLITWTACWLLVAWLSAP